MLTGLLAILYLAKGVRRDVYDHPILYEIRQDGRTRRTGRRADRKIGILSMLGIGKREKDGKKLTVFGNLSGGGDSYHTVWKHGCNINIKVPDVRMVEGILIALAQTVVLVKNKKGGRKYGIIWKDI